MDPYYRTLPGFCVVVEKEWVSFGHRFAKRMGTGGCGYDRSAADDDQRSPVFLQWLDMVWQLLVQFPTSFEFNERLLVALAEHSTSGRFGTFLFDCERQRVEAGLSTLTHSLWSVVLAPEGVSMYTNPSFAPAPPVPGRGPLAAHMLVPEFNPEQLLVWPLWVAKWT